MLLEKWFRNNYSGGISSLLSIIVIILLKIISISLPCVWLSSSCWLLWLLQISRPQPIDLLYSIICSRLVPLIVSSISIIAQAHKIYEINKIVSIGSRTLRWRSFLCNCRHFSRLRFHGLFLVFNSHNIFSWKVGLINDNRDFIRRHFCNLRLFIWILIKDVLDRHW